MAILFIISADTVHFIGNNDNPRVGFCKLISLLCVYPSRSRPFLGDGEWYQVGAVTGGTLLDLTTNEYKQMGAGPDAIDPRGQVSPTHARV